MNLRHAAALALVGWYLMEPPFGWHQHPHQLYSNSDAPLKEWHNVFVDLRLFKTEAECKEEYNRNIDRWKHFEDNERSAPNPYDPPGRAAEANRQTAIDMAVQARCIASDDPGLKENLSPANSPPPEVNKEPAPEGGPSTVEIPP